MVRVVADTHEPRLRWPLALASAATVGHASSPKRAPEPSCRFARKTAPGSLQV